MKKKLLLALMALLPLVGWAADLDPSKFTATNVPYGSLALGAVSNTQGLTQDTHYTVETTKFYTDNTGGGETAIADLKTANVNKYYVKVSGMDAYAGQTIYVDFRVYKANNTVTEAPVVIADGDAGWTGNPKALIQSGAKGTATWGTVEYVLSDPDATAAPTSGWSTDIPTGTNAGTYKIWYRAPGTDNYNASNPVALTRTIIGTNPSYTVPTAKAGLKYTGSAQALINANTTVTGGRIEFKLGDTGTWGGAIPTATNVGNYNVYYRIVADASHNDVASTLVGGAAISIEKDDPVLTAPTAATGLTYNKTEQALLTDGGSVTLGATLKYKIDGGAPVAFADVKKMAAGTYTITPTVAETANTNAKDYTPFNVTIAQKTVYVYVQNNTKVYDGTPFTVGDATGIEINGVLSGDAAPTGIVTQCATMAADVNDYEVSANTTGATVDANYQLQVVAAGTWSITARPITLTAKNQTITFGNAAPAFAVSDTYIAIEAAGTNRGLVAGDHDYVLNAIESVGLKEAKTDIGTYADNIVITPKATAATVAPNYNINVVDGTYKINPAGGYTLIAQNKTVTYGEAYSFSYLAPQGEPVKAVAYEVYDGETKLTANPTDVGTYTIKIAKDDYAPANYGGAEAVIEYVQGTLTINKKELKIACAEQTLRVGKKATDLDATKVEFTGLVPADEGKIEYTLAFNGVPVDGTGALTTANTYFNGIQAVLAGAAATNRNKNYTLSATSVGNLKVVNATTLTFGVNEADDLANLATYNGAEVSVKINFNKRNARTLGGQPRPWKAEEWVVLTLPFEISVSDLSKALGYAIVNVIDPSRTEINGTSSKFYGKLTMKGGNGNDTKLAANKPFLVKTVGDVTGVVDFGSQEIVAPGNDEDALSVDAGRGAKFTGTYTTKEVSKTDEAKIWFMLSGFQNWAYVGTSASATWNIVPLEGFIDMKNATSANEIRSMTFFFEEEDGTVTAIESVNAEGANSAASAAAEGWYTINGVKLEAKPTQKGIYIFNGKKVAIQ